METRTETEADSIRVAVVGVGAVTSLGGTAADLWKGAAEGRVAIGIVQGIDMLGFQTKIGGQVTGTLFDYDVAGTRFVERALQLAMVAAREALGGLPRSIPPSRRGVVLGTCNAGLLSGREWLRREIAGEPPDPHLLPLITPGGIADTMARAIDFAGPVIAVSTACAAGANAIGLAADLIRTGRADVVLAGGTDALSDIVFAGFSSLEALSPVPAAPYSGNRQGLSLGEGSGMVLLMSSAAASANGLNVLAEVAGYGLSADGYHPTAPRPDGSGAARAMVAAMKTAGVLPADVGYVNGHGTGTPKNDPAETKAIQHALGESAGSVLVSSTKSMIGHLLGAAGAVEAIVTIGALATQVAPPTAGYESADPECPLNYVPNTRAHLQTNVALSNNFAFGGANACLVLARPRSMPAPRAADLVDVVVTGSAVLSPAGNTLDDVMQTFADRRDGYAPLEIPRQTVVEVDPDPYLNRRERRRMDRLSVLSVVATARALIAAGLRPQSVEVARCGVIFGTGVGPMDAMERFVRPLLGQDRPPADPGVFPNTVYNQAAGQIAMHLGLYGPTSTLSVGHATGAVTLGYAADLIRAGAAEMVVASVTDTLNSHIATAYSASGLASVRSDGTAENGRFALAEGSVSLVLESRASALARGARVLGVIAGCGLASNGRTPNRWDPAGRGIERAMQAALDAADLAPWDVGDIWLAAAGYPAADRGEATALARLFRPSGEGPRRHAPKIFLGEPLGVGGSLSAALALHGFSDGQAMPALINSSSLTGSHACVLLVPPHHSKGVSS